MTLFCFHKWQYKFRPIIGKKNKVICVKCNLEAYKKVSKKNVIKKDYIWCRCGNDLLRDSFNREFEKGIVEFKCTNCNEISTYDFTICPFPVKID